VSDEDPAPDRTDPARQTAARFRRAVETMQMADGIALLADDVRFESPIVHRRYEGRDAVAPVLFAVSQVFQDFRYTAEFASADGHVLRFSARVGGRDIDGVDILTVDAAGRITDFAVMVRPYSAATALREQMAAMLAASTPSDAVQDRPL
jgi:hypothetical protein